MPLFRWRCLKCEKVSRRILDKRRVLDKCTCGGEQVFDSEVASQVMESLDNGIMERKVERLKDIDGMVKERSLTKDEEGHIV